MSTYFADDDDMDRSSARLSSVPLFKGVKTKFPGWSRRFIAICEQKNCTDALDMELTLCLPTDPKIPSTEDDEQEIQEKALKENRMAMSLLNTALVGDALGIFIYKDLYRGISSWNSMHGVERFDKKISTRWNQSNARFQQRTQRSIHDKGG
jgi:hypothetical protein